MKTIIMGFVLSTLVAIPALAALKPGDAAPDFSAPASLDGKEFTFSLSQSLKNGPAFARAGVQKEVIPPKMPR